MGPRAPRIPIKNVEEAPFLEDGTAHGKYDVMAGELAMTTNAVAVAVHRMRQRYRELVRYEVSQTVATPGEIENELRCLAAALSP